MVENCRTLGLGKQKHLLSEDKLMRVRRRTDSKDGARLGL